ncbi:MAG TPA: DUF1134 domain-containing protein [Candidatus Competibacteraceae bacterium]|nr:DUF1134 domain-containing protein [Candidatus Competibacteraceae bacterium]
MSNAFKVLTSGLLASSLLVATSVRAAETGKTEVDRAPSGTVVIDENQFGLIIGGSTGEGTLTYKGKKHPFKINGITVGATAGAAKVRATGNVYHLNDLSQFSGHYTELNANVAAARSGTGGIRLSNSNGVVMDLQADAEGLQLNLGVGGVKVTMGK